MHLGYFSKVSQLRGYGPPARWRLPWPNSYGHHRYHLGLLDHPLMGPAPLLSPIVLLAMWQLPGLGWLAGTRLDPSSNPSNWAGMVCLSPSHRLDPSMTWQPTGPTWLGRARLDPSPTVVAWPCMISLSSVSGRSSALSLATNQLSTDSAKVNISLFLLVPLT